MIILFFLRLVRRAASAAGGATTPTADSSKPASSGDSSDACKQLGDALKAAIAKSVAGGGGIGKEGPSQAKRSTPAEPASLETRQAPAPA